jgi:hypothetical protein
MKEPHTVTLEELNSCLNQETWNLFASSATKNGSHKTFDYHSSGLFRIMDHGAVVYIGGDKSAAINAYNGAL